ncbi:D-glycerate dehydrogenase [Alteriqipengyuania flavescens]|uniref:2-hydroxyacid dehydrogenase n=1 Tax=Alteriqipengyuania flavescens TaxID=3053610 RepID=UPI0025B4F228|nr:D-glycerate dehydrogenase [Alteriqipengyuania flavescens]WJY18126.1 D-glycerate dehydrogenase [Alteriqipengyuania flavescens]WJY24067.1 D-glycerate dehydrogenase [Alteriqipengyuania flavescens]
MPHSDPAPPTRRVEGKPRVHVTRALPGVQPRMAELYDARFNDEDRALTRDELAEAMRSCDALVPTVTDRIDAELIEQAGDRLGLIANFGAGTDHIDLDAARRRKIIVTNTPGVFTEDTADITLALILAAPRRLSEGATMMRAGKWNGWTPSALLGRSLRGKTLGIVGMGRIGQAVAHRARAFGLDILYHNRHRLPEAVENMLVVRYAADVSELLAQSDIVTLHCPATPQTRRLIDADAIAGMKDGAYLVNTARGELVDEDALLAALQSGKLGGAGLDVYRGEPDVDPALVALPNVTPLPHLGSATWEGRVAAGEKVIANIRFWADGHRPPDQVLTGLV